MTVPFVVIKDDPQLTEAPSIIAGDIALTKPIRGIKFKRTSTNELMSRTFEPIKWVVPGYISEGFLVLAGRQKLGKTWLAIDMALAVATASTAIGSIMCECGDVLYIDMENGPRRIQSRIATLFPDERNRPDLSRLECGNRGSTARCGFPRRVGALAAVSTATTARGD